MTPVLKQFFDQLDAFREQQTKPVPPKGPSQLLADGLFHFLFPILTDDNVAAATSYLQLRARLGGLLKPLYRESDAAESVVEAFFEGLPAVYDGLLDDAQAVLDFDPAATCLEEVIASYPGFYAVAIYRMAHSLHRLGVPFLPRVFTEYVHSRTGIDIHPGATIGRSFFIDHGTGIVIGQTAAIGNFVKMYQGVTLGALQVDKSLANVKRHPTIEDHCVMYANSTILGGRTVVGHHSVIGGNTWLTQSVEPYSIVLHQSQITVRTKSFGEALNFVI
jgi:serine O-acetyltransferase